MADYIGMYPAGAMSLAIWVYRSIAAGAWKIPGRKSA